MAEQKFLGEAGLDVLVEQIKSKADGPLIVNADDLIYPQLPDNATEQDYLDSYLAGAKLYNKKIRVLGAGVDISSPSSDTYGQIIKSDDLFIEFFFGPDFYIFFGEAALVKTPNIVTLADGVDASTETWFSFLNKTFRSYALPTMNINDGVATINMNGNALSTACYSDHMNFRRCWTNNLTKTFSQIYKNISGNFSVCLDGCGVIDYKVGVKNTSRLIMIGQTDNVNILCIDVETSNLYISKNFNRITPLKDLEFDPFPNIRCYSGKIQLWDASLKTWVDNTVPQDTQIPTSEITTMLSY